MTNKKPKLCNIRTAAKLREEMVIRIACIGKKVQPKDFEYLKKQLYDKVEKEMKQKRINYSTHI